MIEVKIFPKTGNFAEDKDTARHLSEKIILQVKNNNEVILDFSNVEQTTQGFIHVLISEAAWQFGPNVFEKIQFKNCNEKVKTIIELVADYLEPVQN